MSPSSFIAGKMHSRERLATVAVGISFFVMIVAVAVAAGFRKEIRKAVSEERGDVCICAWGNASLSGNNPIEADSALFSTITSTPNVKSCRTAVYHTGIIKNGTTVQGAVFKGVSEDDSLSLCARIPCGLGEKMMLGEGDRFTAWFIGETVKARKFTVVSTVPDGPGKGIAPVVLCSLSDLQRVNGWEEDEVTAIEVFLEDNGRQAARLSAMDLSAATGLEAHSAGESFTTLFDWLEIIDVNVAAILILMTIVAGFNMISGMLIILFRNIPTIGILKSLGMKDGEISKVFLRIAARMTLKGMVAGNAAALLFCLAEGTFHFLRLDPANYFVSWVPVSVNPVSLIMTDLICMAAIMLLLSLPTLFISRVDPAVTVKSE